MNERLGELGIDFMLIYPSWTLGFLEIRDDALRAPVCRAANRYVANLFAGLRDRFEPAALIPMHTPEEAVAEINFAARELGFKSVVLHGFAHRAVGPGSERLDFFGLDFFILNVLFTGFLFIPIERLFAQNRTQEIFRDEWREDLFYYLVSSLFVQVLTYLTLAPSNFIV